MSMPNTSRRDSSGENRASRPQASTWHPTDGAPGRPARRRVSSGRTEFSGGWNLPRSACRAARLTQQVAGWTPQRGVKARAVGLNILHYTLHIVAGLGEGDALDPVNRIDPRIARVAVLRSCAPLRTSATTSESLCARAPCGDVTRRGGIPGVPIGQYADRHDRHASDSQTLGYRRLET